MLSPISLVPAQTPAMEAYSEGRRCLSCSCLTASWDKIILLSNTAAMIAGIAYMFFLKLPIISIGLGLYAVAYLAMNRLAERARADISNRPIVVHGGDKASKEITNLQKIVKEKDQKILNLKKIIKRERKRISAYEIALAK